jgi:zinc transporter ZupT
VIGLIVFNAGALLNIVFNSMAGGTFIYIAASEVVVEEFSVGRYKWWKTLAFLLGAAVIFLLWFLEA